MANLVPKSKATPSEYEDSWTEIIEEASSILNIDEFRLVKEWKGQPSLYGKFAAAFARAKAFVEVKKAALEQVDAKLARRIRSDPEAFEVGKITEAAILEVIQSNPKHIAANDELIQAKYYSSMLQGFVEALDHRKKGLESLTQLRLNEFYSEPRLKSGKGKAEVEEALANEVFRSRAPSKKGKK